MEANKIQAEKLVRGYELTCSQREGGKDREEEVVKEKKRNT